jgi:hypothetical protein
MSDIANSALKISLRSDQETSISETEISGKPQPIRAFLQNRLQNAENNV